MAFLAIDDKLKDPNNPANQVLLGESSAPLANAGGAIAPSAPAGVASAPQAAGNGWTNIQAYLNANKGVSTTADQLSNTVGGQFNKERTNLLQTSNEAKTQAQAQVDQNKLGQDQASKMIQEAGNLYSYDPTQKKPEYESIVGGIKSKLNSQYQGPSSYTYGFEAPTQNYGQNLWNDKGFSGIMNSIYDQAAGGAIGSGARTLQQQLDNENSAIKDTRTKLLSQYSNLLTDRDSTLDSTQKAIDQAKTQYSSDQAQLKNYLTSQQGENKAALTKAADQWNAQYQFDPNEIAQYQKVLAENGGNPSAPPISDSPIAKFYSDWDRKHGSSWDFKNGGWHMPEQDNNSAYQNIGTIRNALDIPKWISPHDLVQGNAANETNALGVENQRNVFNAIADVLNTSSIGYDPSNLTPGTIDISKLPPAMQAKAKAIQDQYIRNAKGNAITYTR